MTNTFPKILGLIPARMGSKEVPGKNMKQLGGIPLVQYTIEAAQQAKLLDAILVSTDCPEIAKFARCFDKIAAPFLRPPSLAADRSPMTDVVAHALYHAGNHGHAFDYVLLLQPTCPFRIPGIIDDTIRHILSQKADSLITVRKIPDAFNPFWAYTLHSNGCKKTMQGANVPTITRRQDLPATYHRDGEIYIARASLIRGGQLTGGKVAACINDNEFGINIDTPTDWAQAENLLEQWKDHNKKIFSY